MTIAYVVREVAPGDFSGWLPLWQGYNAFYGRSGATALPIEITRTTWTRFFDPYEPVHCLVAEASGRLVGLAHYIFHRNTTMLGPTCYLQDLFSSETERGQDIGGALVTAVCERARAAGVSRVYWHTHESNAAARRLYDAVTERSGFMVYRKDL